MITNIPKNIYICYKNKQVPTYVLKNLLTYNPGYSLHLYDDQDCFEFLYKNLSPSHAECFKFIPDGPIKADFWRICIIYVCGGIYCDIDIQPNLGFQNIIEDGTTFLTSTSKIKNCLNPIILMSLPHNKILEQCINIYMYKFLTQQKYSYCGWSICPMMHSVFHKITGYNLINGYHTKIIHDGHIYQILREYNEHNDRENMYTIYKNHIVCRNHYASYESRINNGSGFDKLKIKK